MNFIFLSPVRRAWSCGLTKAGVFLAPMLIAAISHAAPITELLPTPPGAQSIQIGEQLRSQGRPIELRRFVVDQPVDEVLRFYRARFGAERVEPELTGHRVIAKRVGDDFITVQLTARAGKTEGLMMKTSAREDVPVDAMRARLPIDSRVLTDMESQEADKSSRLLMYDNAHSLQANADRVRELLAERGLVEQRDKTLFASDGAAARTLWFGGARGEAIAVISERDDRRVVVLNVVQSLVRQ